MIQRRWVRMAIGALLVLAGMGGVASLGWQLFSRHREPMGPMWIIGAVLAASAIVLYLGVHLIFGSPANRTEADRWHTESID